MTTPSVSLKQRLVIAFSCVLVGCAVGATMPRLAAQSYQPSGTAQRWEQFCQPMGGLGSGGDDTQEAMARVNQTLAARGNEGFELVSASFDTRGQSWGKLHVCFKRPAAR